VARSTWWVRESHVALGVPVYPVDHFRLSVWLGTMLPLICAPGSREAAPDGRRTFRGAICLELDRFCTVVLGGFLLFSAHGVDVFRQPCVPSQAGDARADRAHLAHPSPAEIAAPGSDIRHARRSQLAGLIECCFGYPSSLPRRNPQPLILTGANTARSRRRDRAHG